MNVQEIGLIRTLADRGVDDDTILKVLDLLGGEVELAEKKVNPKKVNPKKVSQQERVLELLAQGLRPEAIGIQMRLTTNQVYVLGTAAGVNFRAQCPKRAMTPQSIDEILEAAITARSLQDAAAKSRRAEPTVHLVLKGVYETRRIKMSQAQKDLAAEIRRDNPRVME